MQHSINELKVFRTKFEESFTDTHYVGVKNTHLIDELTTTVEQLKLDCQKALNFGNTKLDTETFDEEIANVLDHLHKSIRQPMDRG